jgi:hypothetical protein
VEAVEVFLLDLLQQVVQELLIKVLLEEQVQLVLHKMVVVAEVELVLLVQLDRQCWRKWWRWSCFINHRFISYKSRRWRWIRKRFPGGTGGAGGGGDGNAIPGNANAGQNGTANTGGGGGGSHDLTGGSGGSGVVILRISASAYSGTTTGSPTVDDDGSFKVLTYTASGSYTA